MTTDSDLLRSGIIRPGIHRYDTRLGPLLLDTPDLTAEHVSSLCDAIEWTRLPTTRIHMAAADHNGRVTHIEAVPEPIRLREDGTLDYDCITIPLPGHGPRRRSEGTVGEGARAPHSPEAAS